MTTTIMPFETGDDNVVELMRQRFQEADAIDVPTDDDDYSAIREIIGAYSLTGKGDGSLTRLPDAGGEDYSKWQAELRRMSPEIEETATSIWRIARITNETEYRQARFEAEMCWDELYSPCHQRTRQKRFIAKRIILIEEALTTWFSGQTWSMPQELWDDMHTFDPDFQNAIMDLRSVHNEASAIRACQMLISAEHEMEVINERIIRDKERHQYRDYSQVIDALINADPEDGKQVLNIIKNNNAYW